MYIGGFIASCSVRFFPELNSSKEVSIERVERMDKEDVVYTYVVCVYIYKIDYSVQFSHSVVSDSLQPHESQNARPPCPSPTTQL